MVAKTAVAGVAVLGIVMVSSGSRFLMPVFGTAGHATVAGELLVSVFCGQSRLLGGSPVRDS